MWSPPRRTSGKILKKNVRYYHLSEGYNEVQLDLLGAIAAVLIDVTLQFGVLDWVGKSVRLKYLCEESFVQKGGHVIKEYGWELDKIKDYAKSFRTLFTTTKEEDVYMHSRIEAVIFGFGADLEIYLEPHIVTALALRAKDLADNALASAQVSFGTLVQFFHPNLGSVIDTKVSFPSKNGCIICMNYDIFLKKSYMVAGGMNFDRISGSGRVPVIISSEGRVLFPRAMLDHSTRQGSLLALVVVPGRIHYEDSCFDSVVDFLRVYSNPPQHQPIRAPIFDMTTRQPVLRVPYEQSRTNLQFDFAKDQGVLLMRTCLSCTQNNFAVAVSYTECTRMLAHAVHVKKSKPPRDMKDICKELRPSKFEKANRNEVSLTPTVTGWDENCVVEPSRLVTHIPNSQELRFFAASPIFQPWDTILYVLQDAELIEVLHAIIMNEKRTGDRWKLITGNDG